MYQCPDDDYQSMNLFEISCNINCENVTFGVLFLFYKFWGCFEACRPARNKWCQKWDSNPVDRDKPPLHDDDSFGADHLNARINLHWIIECSVVPTDLLNRLHGMQESQHPVTRTLSPVCIILPAMMKFDVMREMHLDGSSSRV